MTGEEKKALYALHLENMMILRTMYQHGKIPQPQMDKSIETMDKWFTGVLEGEEE